MSIYEYEEAFGAWDVTSQPMRRAIAKWQELYYEKPATEQQDSCQRIGYTVVNKLVKTMFGEYQVSCSDPAGEMILERLGEVRKEAMQQTLVGGECYLKPCVTENGIQFAVIPRANVLIFARNMLGEPTDLGTVETSLLGKYYYTLLERRTVDDAGYLTITNRLYRSLNGQKLGAQVELDEHPAYRQLPPSYRFPVPLGGIGLVRMKTPMLNCVDGSADGVAAYAAAAGLIENIDRNEAQMNGEFSRGESRIITSADLLNQEGLTDHLFVGLDEDPEQVGMTIFSPQLREQSFLHRKQEYLRNVESLVGLRRGMLCDANEDHRTATEIASSAGDYNLTVIGFQTVWQKAAEAMMQLCKKLSALYHLPEIQDTRFTIDWGNGILYDEEKTWQEYRQMVGDGLLRPEIALGWRFNMPAETDKQQREIRQKLMPDTKPEEST